jgi:hypothetical protein
MTIADINKTAKRILTVFDDINTHITYAGNVFAGGDDAEEDEWHEQKHIARHRVIFRKLGDKYCAELNGWYAHTIALTGLSFNEPLVFDKLENETEISMPAVINAGIGERFLYKALGGRRLTVEMDLNFDGQNENFDAGEVRAISYNKSVSINFVDETDAELDAIYQNIKAQEAAITKHLLLAKLAGNYKCFHKLTGLID